MTNPHTTPPKAKKVYNLMTEGLHLRLRPDVGGKGKRWAACNRCGGSGSRLLRKCRECAGRGRVVVFIGEWHI